MKQAAKLETQAPDVSGEEGEEEIRKKGGGSVFGLKGFRAERLQGRDWSVAVSSTCTFSPFIKI